MQELAGETTIRLSRVTLLITVVFVALSQSPAQIGADEGCSGLYAALRSATGDRLVEVVRRGDLRCLDRLRSDLDPPLQIAVSRESNVVTVANSIPEAMADYTGSGNEGVHQLFLYLRAAEYIHYYCLLDRSCNGEEWNNVETYSMEAGSPVHRAVRAAIDSFVEHPQFRHAGRQHTDTLYDVGYTIIFYEMSGLYLSLVEDWLNDWDDNYAANPIFHRQMDVILDVVSWGHVRPPFADFFGEYRGLVHALRDFVLAEQWLGTSSQWIMERSVMELGHYFQHKNTTNYEYVLPIALSVLTTYRDRPEAKDIFLRLVGEIDYHDVGNCERYGLCDWYAGDGFKANFRAALFTDTMVCPVNACSGDTITIHAQDLEADKLATACQRMYEEGQAFQTLFDTQCTPVPDDLNSHVDVYVFNDGDACWAMQFPAFGRGVDTCSGIYYEHDPSDPDSSAQFIVTEYEDDEYARDPELPIRNFEHEYAHYLDGRYNRHGPYRGHDDSVHWWVEGFAEYLSAEVSPYIGLPRCESPYSLTETLLHSDSIPTSYAQRHLAVRFLMANHGDFIDTLLKYTRQGEYAAYTAHMAAEAPKLEGEWRTWLAACELHTDSRVAPYCPSGPDLYQYGYITRVVLGSLDHADDENLGHRFYDETVSVQAGSTVELRVTASVRIPVEGDVNRVEAWIDWNGDERFDENTEQVMNTEARLTNRRHPVTVSSTVTAPQDGHIGKVRLRVRVQYKQPHGADQGICENYESGETQDYDITVTAVSNPGGGEEPQPTSGGDLFIPVLLTLAGHNDALFTSELTLTNRGSEEAILHYTYVADRGGGSGTATDRLAPGRQRIEPDALSYLRRLGIPIPHSGNRLGTLRVEVSGSSAVSVVTRTTTAVPEGRAGLAYPGIGENEGFQEAVYLCGLRQNSRDRSNVAFQNMGTEGEITLRATVFSGDGADTSSRILGDKRLKPGEFRQYDGVLKALGRSAQGYVKVERVAGNSPFYAYGVINDNFNSDGSFVFPVTESSLEESRGQTLPVIIENRSFTSELTVTNFSASDKQVDFSFVADNVETSDDTATFSLRLKAGEQRIVPQIVGWLRRQGVAGIGPAGPTFVGALFATPSEGDMSGIVIGARTGSPDKRGGQYSLFYNAVPYGLASVESAWIYGLQQNAENRSNLALVNTGEDDGSTSTFEITIYDGTGEFQPRTKRVSLGPRRWRQEHGILGNISQGYVQIRKTSGNNPFVVYGVINDGGRPGERSGDGAILLSQE